MSFIDINIPFKRNYLFEWNIHFPNTVSFGLKDKSDYVMSLCKSVTPPSDEFEIEECSFSTLTFPVVKGEKLGDIKVVYMDDDYDTVYWFHRQWQDLIRSDGLTYKPIKTICAEGKYSSRTKTVDPDKTPEGCGEEFSNGFTNKDSLVQSYPLIYPISVLRSDCDRSENSTATVTVTYKQYPKISKKKVLIKFRRTLAEILAQRTAENLLKAAVRIGDAKVRARRERERRERER